MEKIEKLTEKQERILERFKRRWLEIALSPNDKGYRKAEKILKYFYAHCGYNEPEIVWCDSPLEAELIINLDKKRMEVQKKYNENIILQPGDLSLYSPLYSPLGSSLESTLYSTLGSSLYSTLRSPLGSRLASTLESTLESTLGARLGSSLCSPLNSPLESTLESTLRSPLYSTLRSPLYIALLLPLDSITQAEMDKIKEELFSDLKYTGTIFWGHLDIYWIAFYLFGQYLGVKYEDKDRKLLSKFAQLSHYCSWWYPFENKVLVSRKPIKIALNSENRLHCETGPAMQFRDGFSIYALNGIVVDKNIVETSAEKLDCK